MTIQSFNLIDARRDLLRFYKKAPLVHCMTNEVVQEFTANVLLAMGSSPAMIVAQAEAAIFAKKADALLINVGTLYPVRDEAMLLAAKAAQKNAVPWVLDPVAAGVLAYRTNFCRALLAKNPTAIRGNASEIIALSGGIGSHRGVDSKDHSKDAIKNAVLLAKSTGAVVIVTGEKDYVTDGQRTYVVQGGNLMMTRIVGTGCALSALMAAFLSGSNNPHVSAATACMIFGLAAEKALKISQGPGSFKGAFLDALYGMDPLVEKAIIREKS